MHLSNNMNNGKIILINLIKMMEEFLLAKDNTEMLEDSMISQVVSFETVSHQD